jgi:hypothetical protein
MSKRVDIEDMSEYKKFFPVQAFFNEISDMSFARVIDYLTRGIGYGMQDSGGCTFPSDLDDYELYVERQGKPLEGIEFSLFEDTVVLDVPTFRRFLTMACDAYVKKYPEDRAKIEELLARPQPPLFQESSSPAA